MVNKLLLIEQPQELERLMPVLDELSPVFEYDWCHSMEDAVRLFRRDLYGLVFINLALVDTDAIELLEQIRRSNFFGQIAFTADYTNPEVRGKVPLFKEFKVLLLPLSPEWLKQSLTGYFQAGAAIGTGPGLLTPVFMVRLLSIEHVSASIKFKEGSTSGYLYMEHGQVNHAKCGDLSGLDAAMRLLRMPHAEISLEKPKRFSKTTISQATALLLDEAAGQAGKGTVITEAPGSGDFIDYLVAQLEEAGIQPGRPTAEEKAAQLGTGLDNLPASMEIDLIEAVSADIKNKKRLSLFKKKMIAYMKDEGRKKRA